MSAIFFGVLKVDRVFLLTILFMELVIDFPISTMMGSVVGLAVAVYAASTAG
jgi:hypothetical protein